MTLVDSNVLLDVLTDGQARADWSQFQLERAALDGPVIINDVIYAEVSTRYATVEALDSILLDLNIEVTPIPRRRRYSHWCVGRLFHRCPCRDRKPSIADA